MASTRAAVLGGFRRLLRARKTLFAGDQAALSASLLELRKEFRRNADVSDGRQIQELLKGIDEVEEMMLHNFVQGTLNDAGAYEARIPGHASGDTLQSFTAEEVERAEREMEAAGKGEILVEVTETKGKAGPEHDR